MTAYPYPDADPQLVNSMKLASGFLKDPVANYLQRCVPLTPDEQHFAGADEEQAGELDEAGLGLSDEEQAGELDEAGLGLSGEEQAGEVPLDPVVRALDLLCPNAPVAVCALHPGPKDWLQYEYFDDHAAAARWVAALPGTVKATYIVMNPYVKTSTGAGITAKDITRLRWFLIDCDPKREVKKSNATEWELGLARTLAAKAQTYLTSLGWSAPLGGDTGNGTARIYAIDLPNDAPSIALLNSVLKHLAARFDTTGVEVDQSTGDAAQLTKLYGTMARKGPATDDRPHRLATLTHIPDRLDVVTVSLLQLAAPGATTEPKPKSTAKGLYDLDAILAKVTVFSTIDKGDYTEYQIECPWDAEHSDPGRRNGTIFTWSDEGAPGFACPHSHCKAAGRRWEAFRDHLGITTKDLILKPDDPMPSAEAFVVRAYTVDDLRTLHHQSGVFYGYQRDAGAYQQRDEAAVRSDIYKFLQPAQQYVNRGTKATPKLELTPFQPTISKVANVLDALRAVCNLPTSQMAPCWLHREYGDLDPRDMLAFTNGLLHVPTRKLYMPTPHLFTLNGLDFAYDPWAPAPTAWLAFLHQLWPSDKSSIEMLQEMFGYLLTPDTSFQKVFLLHGPRRSGKGIIGRIVRCLVGERNTCGPALSDFGETFGKQGLIGKTLALISDARISQRTDTAKVAETLLRISGEDEVSVARKFLEDWIGALYVRFVILTNELPHINDASGALASRFELLTFTESFYGREDRGLFNKLAPELPSIALWALEGRDRLYKRGHFVQPTSADQLMQELEDLSSPVSVFLRTHTKCEPGVSVPKKELFAQWVLWCGLHGEVKAGTDATLGRNVRAILPGVQDKRETVGGKQERCWVGVRLSTVIEQEKTDM